VRLICPWVTQHPFTGRPAGRAETREWILAHGGELFELDGADAYWRLLAGLWREGSTVLIVEHDIIPTEAGFESLAVCEEPWCVCGYRIDNYLEVAALGCTKFNGSLMRQFPNALEDAGQTSGDGLSLRHWARLDSRVHDSLRAYGVNGPHIHSHQAKHLKYESTHL
jgi:hypothetical protein